MKSPPPKKIYRGLDLLSPNAYRINDFVKVEMAVPLCPIKFTFFLNTLPFKVTFNSYGFATSNSALSVPNSSRYDLTSDHTINIQTEPKLGSLDLLYFPGFDSQIRKKNTDSSILWIRNLSKTGVRSSRIWLQNDNNSQHALTYGGFDKF